MWEVIIIGITFLGGTVAFFIKRSVTKRDKRWEKVDTIFESIASLSNKLERLIENKTEIMEKIEENKISNTEEHGHIAKTMERIDGRITIAERDIIILKTKQGIV